MKLNAYIKRNATLAAISFTVFKKHPTQKQRQTQTQSQVCFSHLPSPLSCHTFDDFTNQRTRWTVFDRLGSGTPPPHTLSIRRSPAAQGGDARASTCTPVTPFSQICAQTANRIEARSQQSSAVLQRVQYSNYLHMRRMTECRQDCAANVFVIASAMCFYNPDVRTAGEPRLAACPEKPETPPQTKPAGRSVLHHTSAAFLL